MEAEEAVPFDKSYRDYLGLGKGAAVKLIVQ